MRSLLVVGGAGSLGRLIVSRFQEAEPICLDLSPNPEAAESIEVNLMDPDDLIQIRSRIEDEVDVLFLVGRLSAGDTPADRLALLETNCVSVDNFLSVFAERVRNFNYVSSISVYGTACGERVDETLRLSPETLYASSKLTGELICKDWAMRQGFSLKVLRVAQVYDVNSAVQTFPHRLKSCINEGTVFKFRGNLDSKRDYILGTEVAECVFQLMKSSEVGTFNLGGDEHLSFRSILDQVKERCPSFQYDVEGTTAIAPSHQTLSIEKFAQASLYRPQARILDWLTA